MSARIVRSLASKPSMPAIQRGFRTTTSLLRQGDHEPVGPKAIEKPEAKAPNSPLVMIGGVGLALGGAFFFLMGKPEKAKDAPVEGATKKPISPK